jgi:hypothetical protein
MHRLTIIALAVVAGALLWANWRESPLAREWALGPPQECGAVAQHLYVRGWPFSPWMFAIVHGLRAHLEEGVLWLVLLVDAILAFVTLSSVAYLMELAIRRCENRGVRSACQFTLARLLLVITLLSLPLGLAFYFLHGPKPLREFIGIFAVDVASTALFVFCLMAVYVAVACWVIVMVSRKREVP